MKIVYIKKRRKFKSIGTGALILSAFVIVLLSNASNVLAHGGEDHGDKKPAVATTQNGTVSRTARLGDYEILLKHSLLEPDTAASARLFITQFATNEPLGNSDIEGEVESVTGIVTKVTVEKTDAAGSYVVKIPALAEGGYTFRAKVSINGKTDTATLSGIDVGHQEAAPSSAGSSSWAQTALTAFLFLIGSVLFGGLIYLAVRAVKNKPISEEAIAA